MYVSAIIRNTCFLINVTILTFLKFNYDCFALCDSKEEMPSLSFELTRAWFVCIMVIVSDLTRVRRMRFTRNTPLLDAALLVQTATLVVLTLSMMTAEESVQHACEAGHINNQQAVCKRFPNMCVNGNVVIAFYAVMFHSLSLRICVGKLEGVLRAWAPDEYADNFQADEPREEIETSSPGFEEQPVTSPDADPDPEESTAVGDDEQPGIARETISKRRPIEKRVNLSVER